MVVSDQHRGVAVNSGESAGILTFLFTDIEGSSRLGEGQPEQMRQALACHDRVLRAVVERNRGAVVKPTGEGLHAAFRDLPGSPLMNCHVV